MFCTRCGAQMDDNAKFCNSCGAPAVPVEVPPAEPAPEVPEAPVEPASAPQEPAPQAPANGAAFEPAPQAPPPMPDQPPQTWDAAGAAGKGKRNVGLIVGIVVGVLAVIAIIAAAAFFFLGGSTGASSGPRIVDTPPAAEGDADAAKDDAADEDDVEDDAASDAIATAEAPDYMTVAFYERSLADIEQGLIDAGLEFQEEYQYPSEGSMTVYFEGTPNIMPDDAEGSEVSVGLSIASDALDGEMEPIASLAELPEDARVDYYTVDFDVDADLTEDD